MRKKIEIGALSIAFAGSGFTMAQLTAENIYKRDHPTLDTAVMLHHFLEGEEFNVGEPTTLEVPGPTNLTVSFTIDCPEGLIPLRSPCSS